jgi:hypothetical protein
MSKGNLPSVASCPAIALQTLFKHFHGNIPSTVKDAQNRNLVTLDDKGDTHAATIPDNPQARYLAFPYSPPFGKGLEGVDKIVNLLNIGSRDSRPSLRQELLIERVKLGFGLSMKSDVIGHALLGFRQVRLMFRLEAGARSVHGNALRRVAL